MTISNTMQHPSSIHSYIRHGWKLVPIPVGSKGPIGMAAKGWNKPENVISNVQQLPSGTGIGLAHAYSGTMALDVDDWDRATLELAQHGIDLNLLYNAPDAVAINSGKQGHGKLLYRMPNGTSLPSKKLIDERDGQKYNYLDFRCATANGLTVQDVLPPTIHPETQQPYTWGGYGHWSRLPEIPQPLLQFWQSLIEKDTQRKVTDGELHTDLTEIANVLHFISPDINRDEWVKVGMALHWAGIQLNAEFDAYLLWDEWSSTGQKYQGPKDTQACWRSFRADIGITIGTLFHIARSYGWKPPLPSIDELFANVNMEVVDMMQGFRPQPPNMPMDVWPDLLKRRAQEVSESVGCDPIVPLLAGLATACGAINSQIRLQLMPGYEVPPVLWFMTIGEPADKKTPGSKPMMAPLSELERADRPEHKQRVLQWEAQEAAYGAAYKDYMEYASSPEAIMSNDTVPALPDLPPEPVPLQILLNDITSQKMVRTAASRPEGLLCWLDEMGEWIKKVTDPRSAENRSAWVSAFESQDYKMDRVGAGLIYAENLAISLYGNIQPKLFRRSMENLSHDGLIQRFIPAILRPGYTRLGNPIPDAFSLKPMWHTLIHQLHTLPVRTYMLSPGGYTAYREFQQWYEKTKHEERLIQSPDIFMTAYGKLEGQCGRLALILHCMIEGNNQEVSQDTMERAITIIKEYVVPSLRHTYGEVGGLAGENLDIWLAQHLLAITCDTRYNKGVTLRELKHSARRRLEHLTSNYAKDQAMLDAMLTFENARWVALADSNSRTNTYTWLINPAIGDVFKDQRSQVVKIKQARYDDNRRRTGNKTERYIVPGYDPDTMD